MGLGNRHTLLCLPASQNKNNKQLLEEIRLSLIGGSFARLPLREWGGFCVVDTRLSPQ